MPWAGSLGRKMTKNDRSDTPTGFAGLESLISDVEPQVREAAARRSPRPPEPPSPDQTVRNTSRAFVLGSKVRGWTRSIEARVGLLAVILFGALVIYGVIHDRNSPVDEIAPVPRPPERTQESAPASERQPDAAHITPGSAYVEQVPPVGTALALSREQVRWCVYQGARLDMMREVAATNPQIAKFNGYIVDFNSRCANFKYKGDALASAQSELNHEGKRLQAEGVQLLLGLASGNSVASSAPQQAQSLPPAEAELIDSAFVVATTQADGKPSLQRTSVVPFIVGQKYGYVLRLKTRKAKVNFEEVITAPSQPQDWKNLPANPSVRLSADGRSMVVDRIASPDKDGFVLFIWTVAEGDPTGAYSIDIFIDSKLVKTFQFTLQ